MNLSLEVKRLKTVVHEIKRTIQSLALGSMRLSAPDNTQIFDDVDYSIVQFDQLVEARGGLTVHLDSNSITIDRDGIYAVEIGFCAGFPGAEELNLMTIVDDVPYSSEPAAIQGRTNNKPVSLFWKSTTVLKKGTRVQLGAMNGDSGSVTPHIKRLHFEVRRIG